MEIEQAFDEIVPQGKNIGRFQFFIFSNISLCQILLAGQLCLMGTALS